MRPDDEVCIVADMIHICRAGFAVVLTFAMSGIAAAQGPSFDCARATQDVEKAICDDSELARLDVGVAQAYDRVRKAFDPQSADLLRADQSMFLNIRDSVFEQDAKDLAARLRERQAFLADIHPASRNGFAGEWKNVLGGVTVTRKGGETLEVSISSAEPLQARWVCNVEGEARREGDALVITSDADDERWSVRLSLFGSTLSVEQTEPKDTQNPMCGANGYFAGTYFPVSGD